MNVEIGAEGALFPEKQYIKKFSLQCIRYVGGPLPLCRLSFSKN